MKKSLSVQTSISRATKILPTRKLATRIIFEITIARFEPCRINFRKMAHTYCISASYMTFPASKTPVLVENAVHCCYPLSSFPN